MQYLDCAKEELSTPCYIARIREGNDEEFRFFYNDDERIAYTTAENLFASDNDSDESAAVRQVERDGLMVQQRITLHEIFESTEISKLLKAIAELGLDVHQFSTTEDARYTITEKRVLHLRPCTSYTLFLN